MMNEHVSSEISELGQDERLDEVNEQIKLIQKINGLTFGTDALLLAAYARTAPRARAVDLGSGTGIVPLLLLTKQKIASVTAVEIQPSFAELISRNARLNGMEDRLTALQYDVRQLRPEHIGGEVELVLSNPPYMRTDSGKHNAHGEKFIARHEVCGGIVDFCACAGRMLKHGGKFVSVFRPDRLSELMDSLHQAKLEPKRMTFVHADRNTEPCMVLIEAMKGAAPSLRVTAPLLLYEERESGDVNRVLTEKAKSIYDTCLFPN